MFFLLDKHVPSYSRGIEDNSIELQIKFPTLRLPIYLEMGASHARDIQYVSSWSTIVSKGSITNEVANFTICESSDLGAT